MPRYLTAAMLMLVTAGPAAAQNLKKLEFMSGCWEGRTGKDDLVEESWTAPSEHLMTAMARYFSKGKATSWEFTVIQRTDSLGVLYISMPRGEQPDTFRLNVLADEVASFERRGAEFPAIIMYRRTSDGSNIVRLAPPPQLSDPAIEIRMARVKCPEG
ncbi:MAG TPA: DUF6265 family protein [Gemmatimonadales bacterium]|nr:DUF6265 family protein [Gemmatimonadales bacterium]